MAKKAAWAKEGNGDSLKNQRKRDNFRKCILTVSPLRNRLASVFLPATAFGAAVRRRGENDGRGRTERKSLESDFFVEGWFVPLSLHVRSPRQSKDRNDI